MKGQNIFFKTHSRIPLTACSIVFYWLFRWQYLKKQNWNISLNFTLCTTGRFSISLMTRDSLSKVFCINSGFLKKVVLEDPYAISWHFLPFLHGAFKEFSLSVYILYRVRRPEKIGWFWIIWGSRFSKKQTSGLRLIWLYMYLRLREFVGVYIVPSHANPVSKNFAIVFDSFPC